MMKIKLPVNLFVLLFVFNASFFFSQAAWAQADKNYVKYVDPMIGAVNGRWFHFTPASLPFGMVKAAPQTNAYGGNKSGWEPLGYDPRHNSIEGFSHFHEFQIGGLLMMPVTGKPVFEPGTIDKPIPGFRSSFRKENEKSEAGYYSVLLDKYNVKAELTATLRTGFHRYTFPKTDSAHILIDIGHRQGESGDVIDAYIKAVSETEVEGYITILPSYVEMVQSGAKINLYFFISFNKPFKSVDVYNSKTYFGITDCVYPGKNELAGRNIGMAVNYSTTENESIVCKVGVSYTSIANARNNMKVEAGNMSFDDACKNARKEWNKALSVIDVEGGAEIDKVKFYTGLYHSLLGRGISSDVNGDYPKTDGGVGHLPLNADNKPAYVHHNSDAIWGGWWNYLTLWGLAYPEYMSSYVKSHIDQYVNHGWMPDGMANARYAPGMASNFSGLIIASAYNRGIRDFDADVAFKAALNNQLNYTDRPKGVGKYNLQYFLEKGYIPIDIRNGNFSASNTLENSFDCWAVGQMALNMKKNDEARRLIDLSKSYKNLFDNETKFIRPKKLDGSFITPFDPYEVWNGFQEGNTWQYSWFVPHDIYGLQQLMGNRLFNERLDTIFNRAEKTEFGGGKELHSFSGINAIYNHGNQPGLHIPYLFMYGGRPYLTQKRLNQIMNVFYGAEALHGYGYGQDEDQGQLGSWFVLAAMGLFDIQGGCAEKPYYLITAPLFDKVTVKLDNRYFEGKTFEITVKNRSSKNIYIQSSKLNGKTDKRCWLYHSEAAKGGKLELVLGEKPNADWGKVLPEK